MSEPPRLLTVGRMAAELGVPVHRVLYTLRTRPHIRHTALAGIVRLFNRDALAHLRHELNTQDARRAERKAVSHVR